MVFLLAVRLHDQVDKKRLIALITEYSLPTIAYK